MNGNDTASLRWFIGRSYLWDKKVNVTAIIQTDDKETGITEMYEKDKFISKMDTKGNAAQWRILRNKSSLTQMIKGKNQWYIDAKICQHSEEQ